jgi:hypothetical protein
MKLKRSDIARSTPSSGSIFEKGSITVNRRSATRRAAPGALCVWTKPAGAVTAAHCLDFGGPINDANDFNSDLEKVRDRYQGIDLTLPRTIVGALRLFHAGRVAE